MKAPGKGLIKEQLGCVNILCLYADAMNDSLREIFEELAVAMTFPVSIESLSLKCGDISHTLSSAALQNVDIIVALPPAAGWFRDRFANSQTHPWGFPWLEKDLGSSNEAVMVCLRVLMEPTCAARFLRFPDDLRVTVSGHPASNIVTAALSQSQFGSTTPKPTRILTDAGGMCNIAEEGWPTFNEDKGYVGGSLVVSWFLALGSAREGTDFQQERLSTPMATALPRTGGGLSGLLPQGGGCRGTKGKSTSLKGPLTRP
jgi:hypothetical protein